MENTRCLWAERYMTCLHHSFATGTKRAVSMHSLLRHNRMLIKLLSAWPITYQMTRYFCHVPSTPKIVSLYYSTVLMYVNWNMRQHSFLHRNQFQQLLTCLKLHLFLQNLHLTVTFIWTSSRCIYLHIPNTYIATRGRHPLFFFIYPT